MHREAWPMLCTRKSSPSKVKQVISTEPSTGSRKIRDVWTC
jgi:hypothetical protein